MTQNNITKENILERIEGLHGRNLKYMGGITGRFLVEAESLFKDIKTYLSEPQEYKGFKVGDRVFSEKYGKSCEIMEFVDGQLPVILKYMTATAWYSFTTTIEDIIPRDIVVIPQPKTKEV